ncbi:rhombosortase [Marinimicrobium sp. C2-29]|uniref:rhombosortase n=1 Tax=Marinimicrobium sp. C2-29 TaxID=3139825 RepID=UPI00313A4410
MPALPRLTPSLQLTLILAITLLLLGVLPSWSEPLLEFNRAAIDDGQWWRLLTGQWVHYGAYHLAMNLGAFVLCGYILFRDASLKHYATLLLLCLLGVGLGLFFFSPELDYYAGLSGALHGLLVGGILLTFREMPWMNGAALLVVAAKIVQEQWPGFDTSHPLLPVPVAVDAHLYGALVGLVWGVAFVVLGAWRSRHV